MRRALGILHHVQKLPSHRTVTEECGNIHTPTTGNHALLAERDPEACPMSSTAALDFSFLSANLDPSPQALSNPFLGSDDHWVEFQL